MTLRGRTGKGPGPSFPLGMSTNYGEEVGFSVLKGLGETEAAGVGGQWRRPERDAEGSPGISERFRATRQKEQSWARKKTQEGLGAGSEVSRPTSHVVIPKHLRTISTEHRSFMNFS